MEAESTMFDLLPEAIFFDIVSRLPVKSIKRCLCVCKSWFHTFQTPSFVRQYYRTNVSRGSNLNFAVKKLAVTRDPFFGFDYFLLSNAATTIQITETIHVRDFLSSTRIMGECEGLIWSSHLVDLSEITILNPATKQFKLLPKSPLQLSGYFTYYNSVGFGYDYITNDYKVVRFYLNEDVVEDTNQVEVYSLATDTWKHVFWNNDVKDCIRVSSFNTYLNGCYHWLLEEKQGEILAFDMAQETFQTMSFPIGFDFGIYDDLIPDLRVFRDSLAITLRSKNFIDCFEIWVMKEYKVTDSWTRELVIGPISGARDLVSMWTTGEWFFKTVDCRLKLYDPSSKVIKDIGSQDTYCQCPKHDFGEFPSCSCLWGVGVLIYTDNLFPLAKSCGDLNKCITNMGETLTV